MDNLSLGEKVKKARLDLGLTQQEVSGSFITGNMISKIESDTATPSLKTIQYLAELLNRPISYFLSNDWDNKLDIGNEIKLYFEHASFLFKNKEYEKCISYVEQILKRIDKENKNIYLGRLIYILTKSYIYTENYDLINELVDKSIYILECNNDLYYLSQSYFYKSNILFYKKEFGEAEIYILNSIRSLEKSHINDVLFQIKVYFSHAFILYKLKKFEESKQVLEKTLNISKESKCFYNYADTYMLLGNLYEKIRKFADAIYYTKKAILVYKALDELESEADCLKNVGNYYIHTLDFDNASKYLDKALISYKKLNKVEKINTLKSDIQGLLVKKGDYIESIKYLEEIDLEQLKNVDKSRVSINLGVSYIEIGEYSKAEESLKIAEKILNQLNRYDILKDLYIAYGNMYFCLKDFEKAYIYSEKSKEAILALESN